MTEVSSNCITGQGNQQGGGLCTSLSDFLSLSHSKDVLFLRGFAVNHRTLTNPTIAAPATRPRTNNVLNYVDTRQSKINVTSDCHSYGKCTESSIGLLHRHLRCHIKQVSRLELSLRIRIEYSLLAFSFCLIVFESLQSLCFSSCFSLNHSDFTRSRQPNDVAQSSPGCLAIGMGI